MSVSIQADASGTSGTVKVNSNTAFTFDSAGVLNATTVQHNGVATERIVLTASQLTNSGTYFDFTGIPTWAKKVTVQIQDVCTNGSSQVLVQLGTSGGISTSGYVGGTSYYLGGSSGAVQALSTGFFIFIGGASIYRFGTMVLTRLSGNKWMCSSQVAYAGGFAWCSGVRVLPADLDRVRVTTVNGTDSFTQGEISLLIEG